MTAFYNEIDPFAAEWLRELIKAGHIAPGIVDERSIEDIEPNELAGFTQCHFFAGIGAWSYALRQAGWSDDRPIWTGSCPCQSFSAAGKGAGFDDPRHLWPAFYRLIEKCRPVTVFGEQVEAAIRHGWLDALQADMEGSGYAVGAVVFPAAGTGAPHIRSRLYWVADTGLLGQEERQEQSAGSEQCCQVSGLADYESEQCSRKMFIQGVESNFMREGSETRGCLHSFGVADSDNNGCNQGRGGKSAAGNDGIVGDCSIVRMANTESTRRGICDTENKRQANAQGESSANASNCSIDGQQQPTIEPSRPTNGFWRDVDWLLCRDGKWRPVEPGTFPLVAGAAQRVGRLRGYGNAIVAPQAQAFIEAFLTI